MTGGTVDAIAIPSETVSQRRLDRQLLEGSYAGGMSRLIGYIIDVHIVAIVFAIGAVAVEYVVSTVLPVELDLSDTPVAAAIAFAIWSFTYFTYSLATTGRTVGKAIVGTRVVRADGSDLHAGRAAVRVIATSLSFAVFGLGLLLILLRKDRRALHDLIAGTAEIYSWQRR